MQHLIAFIVCSDVCDALAAHAISLCSFLSSSVFLCVKKLRMQLETKFVGNSLNTVDEIYSWRGLVFKL